MTLTLVGTGINFDLTLSAIDEMKNCDIVYMEAYTSPISKEKITNLEKLIGKQINNLFREDVESKRLIEEAKEMKVALLSSGDPLTATTHISLLIDAKNTGIETKVIHNSSVYTVAPAKSGLQIYKFGRTATIPTPRDNYKPTSWFDIITENLKNGSHTLVLLDTEPKPLHAKKALELIDLLDKEKKVGKVIVLSRLGEKNEKISYGSSKDLRNMPLGDPPFCIIIPGKLHLVEEEYLNLFLN